MVEEHGTDLNDKGAEWRRGGNIEGGTQGPDVAMAGMREEGGVGTKQQASQMAGVRLKKTG